MLKKLIQQFLEYLEIEKNRSLMTIRNYHFYLHRFAQWAENNHITKPDQLTVENIRQYRLWLNRLKKASPTPAAAQELKKNTQNYHLIALRSFLKYLIKQDIKSLAPEKIELAKMPERQVEFLEGHDLERLLDMPEKMEATEIIKRRDKAILEMLFSTGLRVSELTNLNREQINLRKEELTVRGKGSKLRIVFISQQARHYLKQYLDARQDVSQAVFISHDRAATKRGKSKESKDEIRLTPRSVQRMVRKYAVAAGINKKVTVHSLRHSFATDLLNNGADIRSVQELLGHSSLTTTQIYTHLTDKKLREVHQAYHARKRQQEAS